MNETNHFFNNLFWITNRFESQLSTTQLSSVLVGNSRTVNLSIRDVKKERDGNGNIQEPMIIKTVYENLQNLSENSKKLNRAIKIFHQLLDTQT